MAAPESVPRQEPRVRLDSWKQIASYLGRTIRTVQRWEQSENLPIHRLLHEERGSIFAFTDELDAWISNRTASSGFAAVLEAPPRPAHRHPWLAIAILATVAAGCAWIVWGPGSPAPTHSSPRPFSSLAGHEYYPSFSPRGDVLFSWNRNNASSFDLYRYQPGLSDPELLVSSPEFDYNGVYSSDGRQIAFLRQLPPPKTLLLVTAPEGRGERIVAELEGLRALNWVGLPGPHIAWLPGNESIVTSHRPTVDGPMVLVAVDVRNGTRRTFLPPQPGTAGDSGAAISPSGRSMVFVRQFGLGTGSLWLVDLSAGGEASGEPRRLTALPGWYAHPVWINDREIVYSTYVNGMFGLRRRTIDGGDSADMPIPGSDGGILPRYDTARRRLVFSTMTNDDDISRVTLNGNEQPEPLIRSTRQDISPRYSPDGRHIAFISARAGSPDVWVCTSEGGQCRQRSGFNTSLVGPVSWSPDSRQIVVNSASEGAGDLWVIPATSGPARKLVSHPAPDGWPWWSRDGRWIYFTSKRTGRWEIFRTKAPVTGAETGEAEQFTTGGGYAPMDSPDGNWLYYLLSENQNANLMRRPVAGGSETLVTTKMANIGYDIHPSGIYYFARSSNKMRLERAKLDGSEPEGLVTPQFAVNFGLSVSPDGNGVLFTSSKHNDSGLMVIENYR